MDIPQPFQQQIIREFGVAGQQWLGQLPHLLQHYAERWSLELEPAFPALSFNFVAPVRCADGSPAVLKLGVPRRELETEIAALMLYREHGCIRLLKADAPGGAMLLERAFPGAQLSTLVPEQDELATSIAVNLMRQLWCPVPADHPFPSIGDWAASLTGLRQRYAGGTGPFPQGMVDRAEALFSELLGSMDTLVVLHGDLHHYNILSSARCPWLVIDPKGVVGEPACEAAAFLWNPSPQLLTFPVPARIMRRRLDQLAAELMLDRERIRSWAIAQMVLSGWWSTDESDRGWEYALACAELLVQS